MAPNTALCLVLLGSALFLIDVRFGRSRPGQWCALTAGTVALAACVGYAYDVRGLYGVPGYKEMAGLTATTLLLLSAGVLFSRPREGLMAIVSREGPVGVLVRRLFPAAILAPILVGWVRLEGQHAGWYDAHTGTVLTATLDVVFLLIFLSLAVTSRAVAEEKFRGLLESAPEAMVIVNQAGRMVLVNAQTEKLFGYSREELLGQPVEMLLPARLRGKHEEDRIRYATAARARPMGRGLELCGLRKDGVEIPVEISLSPMRSEEGVLISSAIRDITDRKRMEQELQQLALTDSLTGLGNYRRLEMAFETESKWFARNCRPFAFLLLDMDGLKKINDTYGHLVGSCALCRLADAVRVECRSIDTAVRFGGDEFAMILPDTDAEGAENLAHRLRSRLANENEKPAISFSHGVAVYARDESFDQFLAVADRALYGVKKARS